MDLGRDDLVHDLRIFGVHAEGIHVNVDLVGGSANLCAAVQFTFEDANERARHLAVLARWHQLQEPVTFVGSGDTVTLLSERDLLSRALR